MIAAQPGPERTTGGAAFAANVAVRFRDAGVVVVPPSPPRVPPPPVPPPCGVVAFGACFLVAKIGL